MIESVLSSLFTLENLLWINVGLAGLQRRGRGPHHLCL